MTSLNEFNSLVGKITTAINDTQTLHISTLLGKLEKAADANPSDMTVNSLHRVLSKFEDNKKQFISRALLKDLYNKHYTVGSKFADLFADELGTLPESSTPTFAPQYDAKPIDQYAAADPMLVNALSDAFGCAPPLAPYSMDASKKAIKVVSSCLDLWGLSTSKLSVSDGNDKFIVVRADYDSPKGKTSILIPVEFIDNKAMAPVVFMSNAGPAELNNGNLKGYLTSHTGERLLIKASDVVSILTKAATKERRISDVEMAIIRMNASDDSVSDQNAVLGLKVAETPVPDVALPKAPGFEEFAKHMDTPAGLAGFKFGDGKVALGQDMIVRVLAALNIQASKIAVVGMATDTVIYGVSLNGGRVSFNVPVRIANNRVMIPEVMVCNGSIKPLNKKSIASLMINGETDVKTAAVMSAAYGLKTSELIDNIRHAVAEDNDAKAEDALNVIAESGDKSAYRTALSVYMSGLANGVETTKCANVMHTPNSNKPVCGHTGLPLDKVYQDKHGVCLPLYHRSIQENYKPALLNTYKVFGW
jgi:hypothetical protein